MEPQDLEALRREHVDRGRPLGTELWTASTARRMGLLSTIRPLGRPRKG